MFSAVIQSDRTCVISVLVLDRHQWAFRTNRSTEDIILTALHSVTVPSSLSDSLLEVIVRRLNETSPWLKQRIPLSLNTVGIFYYNVNLHNSLSLDIFMQQNVAYYILKSNLGLRLVIWFMLRSQIFITHTHTPVSAASIWFSGSTG